MRQRSERQVRSVGGPPRPGHRKHELSWRVTVLLLSRFSKGSSLPAGCSVSLTSTCLDSQTHSSTKTPQIQLKDTSWYCRLSPGDMFVPGSPLGTPVHLRLLVLLPLQRPLRQFQCDTIHRRCAVRFSIHRRADRGKHFCHSTRLVVGRAAVAEGTEPDARCGTCAAQNQNRNVARHLRSGLFQKELCLVFSWVSPQKKYTR